MLLIAERVRITLLVAFPDKCRRSGPAEIHFYGNAVYRPEPSSSDLKGETGAILMFLFPRRGLL